MAGSALQRVWDDLVATLEGIRIESGYSTTVRTVTTVPTSLLGLTAVQTPAVVVWWDASRSNVAPSALGDVVDDTLGFALDWRLDCPTLSEADRRAALAGFRADLERAVCDDSSRGGVAWDTEITDGTAGPWMDATGIILGASVVTVRVARPREAA